VVIASILSPRALGWRLFDLFEDLFDAGEAGGDLGQLGLDSGEGGLALGLGRGELLDQALVGGVVGQPRAGGLGRGAVFHRENAGDGPKH
jgi:hypothetical protein